MKIAVCDDEVKMRENVERYIKIMYADFDVVTFSCAEELLEYEDKIDIVFLDIKFDTKATDTALHKISACQTPEKLSDCQDREQDMYGMTGMEAARELRRLGSDVTIIFVTGAEEYVFEAFDVGAFHYLVKPFEKVKFYEVLKKAINEREIVNAKNRITKEQGIVIKRGATTSKIYLCDICYIEVFNRKLIIHRRSDDMEIYGSLSDFEAMLSEDFVRCHRANIVNLRYVRDYDRNNVYLENGANVLMSKQKYPEFVKRYMQWIKYIQENRT